VRATFQMLAAMKEDKILELGRSLIITFGSYS